MNAAHNTFVTEFDTPLGLMTAAASDEGVCLLEFNDRRALPTEMHAVERRFGPASRDENEPLRRLREELEAYFAGALREFGVPLVVEGTPFERMVWERLRAIPYGRTRSYGSIANELGRAGAQRAVGRANGRNRIAIVIPCHRVIEASGNLHGYGGGIVRKRFLLELEQGVCGHESGMLWPPALAAV